ncbi:MAG: tRNA threonylcarbamoyladenosine dehydratase [Bacteroidales bacterium]|nr:tRNA threonylcarbamoyladenosine dehydratase [Bacteroidales bacterium]
MTDWLSRTELLLGVESLNRIKAAKVLVAGLGGVGSYAAEMICRAGIGSMTIVDGDSIQNSNRNRQLIALTSTEGHSKTAVMASRLLDINPGLKLKVINEFIRDNRIGEIIDDGFDYVVDAIDTLSPKVFLIYHSIRKQVRIVSSMGSGGKVDPLKINIADISETTDCSLARVIRKRLHRLNVIEGVTAVYSPESIDKTKVIPIPPEQNKASIVGTISYMPAAFGLACASVVIRDLAGIPR